MQKRRDRLVALVLVILLVACATPIPEPAPGTALEQPVTEIPLAGPIASQRAEVSGLAWYRDYLILLPQYPTFSSAPGDGAVYALAKADLLAYLDGATTGPLEPFPIPFLAPGLAEEINGFEGYEAIVFLGDQVFLTIEASPDGGMKGYLVSGTMAPDFSGLTLNTAIVPEIEIRGDEPNKSDESLVVAGETIVTIYEVNGRAINASPVAHLFDTDLTPTGTMPFPQVEYRITDATALDNRGRFWAINYFFPGDKDLRAESDPLAERHGKGPTHARYEAVERLVEFRYIDSGIDLADTPPIQLELLPSVARNWEGLVRLDDRGFLLVTDLFPDTILGFVALPGGE